MDRIDQEKAYWNKCSQDPDLDVKYISDMPNKEFKKALGTLDGRVLEIGCGVGRLIEDGYYGIDLTPGMLEIAKKRKPKGNYKLCDGRTIPHKDKYFDSVYCVLLFQHIPFDAVESYISEASRVLKKGGIFRFQFIEGREDEPFSKHHLWQKVKKALTDNGFKAEKEKGLVHEQWTWVTAVKK